MPPPPPSSAPPKSENDAVSAAALWRMRYASSQAPTKAPPSYQREYRRRNEDEEDYQISRRLDSALEMSMQAKERDKNSTIDKNRKKKEVQKRRGRREEDDEYSDESSFSDEETPPRRRRNAAEKKAPKRSKEKTQTIKKLPQAPPTKNIKEEEASKVLKGDPMKPTAYPVRTIPFVLRSLQKFITSAAPSGGGVVLRCFIERHRTGAGSLFPVYKLYSDHEDGTGRFVMAARRMPNSATAHYTFSTSVDDLYKSRTKRTKNYLGKLRGDASGSVYILYDAGDKPTTPASPTNTNSKRKELLALSFSPRKGRHCANPRHLEVALPQVRWRPREATDPPPEDPELDDGGILNTAHIIPTRESENGLEHMLTLIQGQGAQNVLYADKTVVLHMRESKYDPLSSCLVDFKSRASMASSKNFQLIKSHPLEHHMQRTYYAHGGEGSHLDPKLQDDPKPILLQMGKVGKNCFNMDYQFPLSMLQAFAICIARFDTRVAL